MLSMLFENVTGVPKENQLTLHFRSVNPLESLEPNLVLRFNQGLFCGKEQHPPKLTELREDSAKKYHTDVENCLSPWERSSS